MLYIKEELKERKDKLEYLYDWFGESVYRSIHQKNEDIPVGNVFNELYDKLTQVQKKEKDKKRKHIYKQDKDVDTVVLNEIRYEKKIINDALVDINGKNASEKEDEIAEWLKKDYPYFQEKESQSNIIKNRDKLQTENMNNKPQPPIQINGEKHNITIQTGNEHAVKIDNNNVVPSCNDDNETLLRIEKKVDKIDETTTKTKDNTEEIKRLIQDSQKAIEKMSEQQKEDLSKELIEWLTMAFVAFEGVVVDKFEEAKKDFEEANKPDNVQVKAQLSLPLFVKFFTGLDLIVEVDAKNTLKSMAKTICEKIGLNSLMNV